MPATFTSRLATCLGRLTTQQLRRYGLYALLLVVGAAAALVTNWLLKDPHPANIAHVKGTVTWSNSQTRMFQLAIDGKPADPTATESVLYRVLGIWKDASGNSHDSDTYPACLTGSPNDPVNTTDRPIELDVVRAYYGGPQAINIAVNIRCLGYRG